MTNEEIKAALRYRPYLTKEEAEWINGNRYRCKQCGHLLIFATATDGDNIACLLDNCSCEDHESGY